MQNSDPSGCLLCGTPGSSFYTNRKQHFLLCPECKGLFVPKQLLPNPEMEKARYMAHQNDVNNTGYQQFVMPLVKAVIQSLPHGAEGLDFGAGPGPVASSLLEKAGFCLNLYDPFFHPEQTVLNHTYDFIICSEVAEHFHSPYTEFQQLRKMLKPGGILFCLTHLYSSDIDFKNWYYKNDFTHVFIYQKETFEWIKKQIGYSRLEITDRLIVLTN